MFLVHLFKRLNSFKNIYKHLQHELITALKNTTSDSSHILIIINVSIGNRIIGMVSGKNSSGPKQLFSTYRSKEYKLCHQIVRITYPRFITYWVS